MAKADKRKKTTPLPAQVERAITAAEDKKATDLVVLDLRKATGFTDFFLICTGGNARQIRAIADSIVDALAADGARPAHVEGYDRSNGFCSITSISSCTSSPQKRGSSTASSGCGATPTASRSRQTADRTHC